MAETVEDFDAEFETLLEDIADLQKRAEGARALETRSEFVKNLYPLLASLVEIVHARFTENEALIAEQLDPTESVVMPELTQRIGMVLAVGGRLAEIARILSATAQPSAEDQAKIAQLLENKGTLTEWISGYHANAQAVMTELQDVTIEESEEEEGDEGEGADEGAEADEVEEVEAEEAEDEEEEDEGE